MTPARRTTPLAILLLLAANAAQAAVPPALVPSGRLSDVRTVCGEEIRASRAQGNKSDADFDADLTQLHDSLRQPPPAKPGKDTGIRAEPQAFSHDADGRASYLLVSCLIYLVDSQRIGTDLVRIAQTWPDIRADLVQGFGPIAAPAPVADSGAARCEQAYAAQEAEFADIDRRNPARQPGVKPETVPVLPGLQVALYMTSQRLLLLDTQCKSQARYAEYPAVRAQFDAAVRACAAFTGNTHDCQARLAW